MKKVFSRILVLIICFECIAVLKAQVVKVPDKPITTIERSDLIGTWEFAKLIDRNGNKIDTIWHGSAYEIAKGPLMIFNSDGTYSFKFTPTNTDTGKWQLNTQNGILTLLLYIDPNTFIGNDLIKRGQATKNEDGKYYEPLEYRILTLTKSTMQILDYWNLNMIYNRIK